MGGPGSGPRKGQRRHKGKSSAGRALTALLKDGREGMALGLDDEVEGPPPTFPTITEDDLDVFFDTTRPNMLTLPRVQQILNSIVWNMTARHAAIEAGIDERTFYKWLQRWPKFATLVEQARAMRAKRIADGMMRDLRGNPIAALAVLDRLEPKDWGRKERIEHSVQVEVGINVNQVLLDPAAIAKASELEGLLQHQNVIEGEAREVRALPEHEDES